MFCRTLPPLRNNVIANAPRWTNNNAESLNHVLKSAVQWRAQPIGDLIHTIKGLVNVQYTEADRSIVNAGNFILSAEHARHTTSLENWERMSDKQKQRVRDKCFRLQPVVNSSTTSDGTTTLPANPQGSKKPHAKRRQRADRTRTVTK
jgi:hypothetical protein